MADPTTPTTTATDTADSLNATADAATQAQTAFGNFNTIVSSTKSVLGDLDRQLAKVGVNLNSNEALTQSQSAAFGMLTTSVLGTRKAFDQLNGVDSTRLNTFTRQWNDLQQVLQNSPGIKTAKDAMQATVDALVKAGAPVDKIEEAVKKGIKGVQDYGSAFFESADNALRLQNSIIQLSAKTGGLNDVLQAAGPNLDNINQLTATYQKSITDASSATDLGAEQMEQYYAIMASVPGAMQQVVKSSSDATKNVSLLTAATQYSIGSGRDYKEVVEDLRTAFRNYHIQGEEALQFTSRMGEISNKFGLELSDVRSALTSTSDNFKMFGNEAEGAAKMMNEYLGALESTGLSGAASVDVIQGMTQGIKGLSIAQKSFLSAQSGGPGGLMGGYKIEELLREGKLDEVMSKVKTTLTRQMGPLVSLSEAANSPQAAAQMTKQIAMLRQGPLGSFAKDDQTAMRIIEGMRNQQSGKSILTDLSKPGEKGGTQDIMKTGVEIQKKSHTELTNIRQLIQSAQGMAGVANLTSIQRVLTAGSGAHIPGGDVAGQMRRDMSRSMEQGGLQSGQTTEDLASGLQSGKLPTRQTVGRDMTDLINEYKKFFGQIPDAVKGSLDSIKSMFSQGKVGEADAAYQAQVDHLNDLKAASGLTTGVTEGMADDTDTGANLGDAASVVARRQLGKGNTTATGAPQGMPMHPHMNATDNSDKILGEITVNVQGYCLDCGEKIRSRSQSYAVAPQIKS